MSASLVGSEMCIRDRGWRHGRRTLVRSGASGAALRLPTTASAGCTPVSYTHLTLPTICSV
eukprot:13884729-Alexandrium_andersonii.AAC.1